MKFVLFYHSFVSCWNHGNAHFLRGVARELIGAGHAVTVYEAKDGWSRTNAIADGGSNALQEASRLVPGAELRQYSLSTLDLDQALESADVVLVHEWNEPELIARLGSHRIAGGSYRLFFHDTHHRGVTAPDDIERFDLEGYDGVLAFGEVLCEVYRRRGWGRQVYTWHEAADTAHFRVLAQEEHDCDLVWIGNWGDGERGEELENFLVEPVARIGISACIHGVRYPREVQNNLAAQGIEYAGWLPNHRVPEAFARARVTVHVPRRPYVEALPGIPTIRVFEALACGIPLVSAPWRDTEGLFPAGAYLSVKNSDEMAGALSLVLHDRAFAAEMADIGLQAIQSRHTCRHRVEELLAIVRRHCATTSASMAAVPTESAVAP
jgi:spore maturation protein CgeB